MSSVDSHVLTSKLPIQLRFLWCLHTQFSGTPQNFRQTSTPQGGRGTKHITLHSTSGQLYFGSNVLHLCYTFAKHANWIQLCPVSYFLRKTNYYLPIYATNTMLKNVTFLTFEMMDILTHIKYRILKLCWTRISSHMM